MNKAISTEVEKIHRRIPKWFENPNQKNSTLLIRYLELKEKNNIVSYSMLKTACGNMNSFKLNYKLMKSISFRNYAMVFQEDDGNIELWSEVSEFITSEYKKYKCIKKRASNCS